MEINNGTVKLCWYMVSIMKHTVGRVFVQIMECLTELFVVCLNPLKCYQDVTNRLWQSINFCPTSVLS